MGFYKALAPIVQVADRPSQAEAVVRHLLSLEEEEEALVVKAVQEGGDLRKRIKQHLP